MNDADPSPSTLVRADPGRSVALDPDSADEDARDDVTHVVRIDPLTEAGRRAAEAVTTVADSTFGVRGLPAGRGSVSWSATFAAGAYTADDVPTLRPGPVWTAIHLEPATGWNESAELDLRVGIVRHVLRHGAERSEVQITRFLSAADVGVGVQTMVGPPSVSFAEDAELIATRDETSDHGVVVAAHDDINDTDNLRAMTRLVGMGASVEDRPVESATDRLAAARRIGRHDVEERHRRAWSKRWSGCGTWFPDRTDLEKATRFATFQLLCCGSTADRSLDETAIGARGLTGTAYRGHVFWDTDVFVVPALSGIAPTGARRALNYRWARLGSARARALEEGRRGARFPWESAHDGTEVTPRTGRDLAGQVTTIRTGEMEVHITADIAWAVGNHIDWTGDVDFLRGRGLDVLVATARYWASRVELDDDGAAHIRHVIGPDEYHEAVDDNVFTNVMVRHNLLRSADAAERFGVCDEAEVRSWREIAERVVDGFDSVTGLYEQFAGYHALSDTAVSSIGEPPLSADVLLGYEAISRSRIIKQPDVLMAYHLVPHLMHAAEFDRNLSYYSRYTAHGSSLSPAVMASLFFRARRSTEGMQLFELAGALDLEDVTGTTAGGLHVATMGGLWQAVTFGLLGMRADRLGLAVDPRVPPEIGRVRHRATFRGVVVDVDVDADVAVVTATDALDLRVGGEIRRGLQHRLAATKSGWEHR